MQWHAHRQGQSSRCLVKAEEISIEYKHVLIERIRVTYTFSCVKYVQLANLRMDNSCPHQAWRLLIVLGSVGKIESWEATNWTRWAIRHVFRLASLLSLVRGSRADNADVNIQSTQRGVQNDNNWWLCNLLSFLCLSPSREPGKMTTNINATKRNALPVLYNINSSTVISPQHQHYIYIWLYIYNYIRNMKPYECKMRNNVRA